MKGLLLWVFVAVGLAFGGPLDPPPYRPPAKMTASGLTVTVPAFTALDDAGNALAFAGGTLAIPANGTYYVYVNLKTGLLQGSTRNIDRGGIYVGRVITGSSSVTSFLQPTEFLMPRTRIPRTLQLLNAGYPVRWFMTGDSVSKYTGPSTGQDWLSRLTSTGSSAYGQNITGVANLTVVNVSLGGSAAIHGLAMSGSLVRPADSLINAVAAGNSYTANLNMRRSSPYTSAMGPGAVRGNLPDLVVIEYGLNLEPTATSQSAKQIEAHFIEAEARLWRSLGVEVIIVASFVGNDGSQSARTFLQDYSLISNIARDCDAELSDWEGGMRFQVDSGVAVYSGDNLHPSNLGGAECAKWTGGLFHSYTVPATSNMKPRASQAYGSYGYSAVRTSRAEVCVAYTGTGAATTTADATVNLNSILAGTASGSASYGLANGQTMTWSHDGALEMWAQVELDSGGSATISVADSGGALVSPITITGGANTKYVRILSYADFSTLASGGRYRNGRKFSLQSAGVITVTSISGASLLKINALIFLTHEKRDIPIEAMRLSGTWATETLRDFSLSGNYTDTTGSSVTMPFSGDYVTVFFEVGSQAGTVNTFVDGEQVDTAASLNTLGGGTYVYAAKFSPGNPNAALPVRGRGSHTVRIALVTAGSSPAAQNRSMTLVKAVDCWVD